MSSTLTLELDVPKNRLPYEAPVPDGLYANQFLLQHLLAAPIQLDPSDGQSLYLIDRDDLHRRDPTYSSR